MNGEHRADLITRAEDYLVQMGALVNVVHIRVLLRIPHDDMTIKLIGVKIASIEMLLQAVRDIDAGLTPSAKDLGMEIMKMHLKVMNEGMERNL